MMMGGPGGPGGLLQRETSKPRSVGATLARFWLYFGKYKLILFVVAALVIASTYMQVLVPDLLGQAVDCYFTPATAKAFSGGGTNFAGAPTNAGTNCWYAS